jgi:GNAT superfamily N-acetyltransferase
MPDMLIRIYALPEATRPRAPPGWVVRKPTGPEHDLVVDWVRAEFGDGWASEARVALQNRPISLCLAVRDGCLEGFACYDATARGMVGPIGVRSDARRSGIGAALLHAILEDMRTAGYAYAVAGDVGAEDFFRAVAGATAIEGSSPGLYAGRLQRID